MQNKCMQLMAVLLYSTQKVLLERTMRIKTMLYSDWKSTFKKQGMVFPDGIPRYVCLAAGRTNDPQAKVISCYLFKTTPQWHVALLPPVCSSQTHRTISFPSLFELPQSPSVLAFPMLLHSMVCSLHFHCLKYSSLNTRCIKIHLHIDPLSLHKGLYILYWSKCSMTIFKHHLIVLHRECKHIFVCFLI